MSAQPTADEVRAAFNNATLAAAMGFQGGHAAALVKLREIRAAKTTWVFTKELNLRREVDDYLDSNRPAAQGAGYL